MRLFKRKPPQISIENKLKRIRVSSHVPFPDKGDYHYKVREEDFDWLNRTITEQQFYIKKFKEIGICFLVGVFICLCLIVVNL